MAKWGKKRVESNGLVGEKGTRKDRKNERKTNRKKKANKSTAKNSINE